MRRAYDKGQAVMNWLYAGPFEKDVSERYTDNYIVPFEPYEAEWKEAVLCLENSSNEVKENDPCTMFSRKLVWRPLFAHEADTQITMVRFGVRATLLSTLARTALRVAEEGEYTLIIHATGAYRLTVNGVTVDEQKAVGRVDFDRKVPAHLSAGDNEIALVMLNVHLHCQNIFRLILDEPCETEIQLDGILEDVRERAETAFRNFYVKKAVITEGEKQTLANDNLPDEGQFCYELYAPDSTLVADGPVDTDGRAVLPCSDDMSDGTYTVRMFYEWQGVRVEGAPVSFQKLSFMKDVPDTDIGSRKRFLLERFAMSKRVLPDRVNVFREIAKFATGNAELFDACALERTLDYINDRFDCSDFAMHGVLRFYAKYASRPEVTAQTREKIRNCILNFKYWVDEPGKSLMFTRSENHEMLFYSAEYVAGMLFPTDIFTNSGQNGLFHALKGRINAEHWIREKGVYGFTEWHSNTYYEEDVLALLTIWDFGEENGLLRQLAKQLLDEIMLFIASNSSHGIMATTHGRCYETALMHPETEAMSRLNWVLFGEPKRLTDSMSIGSVALCTSRFEPDRVAVMMQKRDTLNTVSRMGLFRGSGQQGVCCSTYRTAHYMVSGLVESKAGEHGAQVNAGQVLLEGEIPVFVTCFGNRSPNTRPSYFGGQYVIPKTVTKRNVMGYLFDIQTVAGYTHCYIPLDDMDETRMSGNWMFACKGGAFIGIYCSEPYSVTDGGSYKQRELLCMKKTVAWLFELGDVDSYASFNDFVSRVSEAPMRSSGADIEYQSPSQGLFKLSYHDVCTCEEEKIARGDMPLIENEFVCSEYGSGKLRLTDGRVFDFFV